MKYCQSCHIEDERAIWARKISVSFSSLEPQIIAGQMCSTAMSHFVKGTAGFRSGPTVSVSPFDSSPDATDVFVVLVLGLDDS